MERCRDAESFERNLKSRQWKCAWSNTCMGTLAHCMVALDMVQLTCPPEVRLLRALSVDAL
jgi:hypothetical protein